MTKDPGDFWRMLDELRPLLADSRLTEFHFEVDGRSVSFKREAASLDGVQPVREDGRIARHEALPTEAVAAPAPITIRAGMGGVYYSAPDPDSPPFVSVGSRVTPFQQLCLVESMKILHAVESDCAGVIIEVLQANGTAVKPDSGLFVLQPE